MNKIFYLIATSGVIATLWTSDQTEKFESVPQYRNTELICSQGTFFSYARNPTDQVYFPVLKSAIHHTYN